MYAMQVARNPLRVYRHIGLILLNVIPIAFKYIWYYKVARKINCMVFTWLERFSVTSRQVEPIKALLRFSKALLSQCGSHENNYNAKYLLLLLQAE